MLTLELLDPASLELDQAAEWYEDRAVGLGRRFLDEAQSALEAIATRPLGWSPWILPGIPTGVRHVPLRSFPYSVVFITDPRLVVVAFVHGSRDPAYWLDRLSSV